MRFIHESKLTVLRLSKRNNLLIFTEMIIIGIVVQLGS